MKNTIERIRGGWDIWSHIISVYRVNSVDMQEYVYASILYLSVYIWWYVCVEVCMWNCV